MSAPDGIYNWVAFLPSRGDGRVPVANRYFGAFRGGQLKLRGIEARRRDTPKFIRELQIEMITQLAEHPEAQLPKVVSLLRRADHKLRAGRIPLEDLLITQVLSRELAAYRCPSPVARAAMQLAAAGRETRLGQAVRFLYTRGETGVRAWDLPPRPDPQTVEIERYRRLLLRAAGTVLQPWGISESDLALWLCAEVGVGAGQVTMAV